MDANGYAYIVGQTYGGYGFPATEDAIQNGANGMMEGYIIILDEDGDIEYASLLGGTGWDSFYDIELDSEGNMLVCGSSGWSGQFPATELGWDNSPGPGTGTDGLVFKISGDGHNLIWATYLGGDAGTDVAHEIAVDNAGNAYVTGLTQSWDFPTHNALYPTMGGPGDAFVTKLNSVGQPIYSTFLGGSGGYAEIGYGITCDTDGNAYIAGRAWNSDFPTTAGVIEPTPNGDGFVSKISSDGQTLIFSTGIGSNDNNGQDAKGIAIDSEGNVYTAINPAGYLFPVMDNITPPMYSTTGIGVVKLNADGTEMLNSVILGGWLAEDIYGMVNDDAGNIYFSGRVQQANPAWAHFPTTANAYQSQGDYPDYTWWDACVTKLSFGSTVDPPTVDLGDDITSCEGETVTLDAGNPECTYLWSTGATTQTIDVTAAGNYSVEVTNGAGSDTDDIDIFFTLLPTVDAGVAATICENQTYTLLGLATDYSATLWTTSGDGTFDDTGLLTATYTPGTEDVVAGTVTLSLTATPNSPCIGEVADNMILTISLLPVANAGDDATIYIGYPPLSTQLVASGGVSYSWSPTTGLSDPDIADPIAEPSETTVYTVTVTDAFGCADTDDVMVEVVDVTCGKKGKKVWICHIPPGNPNNAHSICVSFNAVAAHLAHGDYLGQCTSGDNLTAIEDLEEDLQVKVSPNPFNYQISMSMHLPSDANVEISIYSISGLKVNTLHSGNLSHGDHTFVWEGDNYKGSQVSKGMYILQINHGGIIEHHKLLRN